VVNADGKGEQALTESPGFNALAAYSPDQRYIAYVHFDRPIAEAVEGGTLMLYDLEALTHTPIAPQGLRCGRLKLVWKPQPGDASR
jgi:Tol biopolymer transport system component